MTISGLVDLAGNELLTSETIEFTTGSGIDIQSPQLLSQNPISGALDVATNAVISAEFDERLDRLSVTDEVVRLQDVTVWPNYFYVSGEVQLSADQRTVSFVPTVPLLTGRLYHLSGSNLQDLAGNRLGANLHSFTTVAE